MTLSASSSSPESGAPTPTFGVPLTAAEQALFARHGRARRVAPATVLFERDAPSRTLFVITAGEIEIEFEHDGAIERIGSGYAVGALGLLDGDVTCPASGVAILESTLVELDTRDFARLVGDDATTLCGFMHRAFAHALEREHALVRRLRAHNTALQDALDRLQDTAEELDRAEAMIGTDELTGLPNRRGLERRLDELRDTRTLDGLGLLLIDCDRFRAVNAVHGHAVGDRLLQAVAQLLVSIAGTDDIVCRLGEDVFCVIVTASDRSGVQAQADCVIATAHGLLQVPRTPPLICALSIGACFIDAESGWRRAHARAADALARAKQRGGNRVEWAG